MLLQFIEVSNTVQQALDCINAGAKREKEHFPEAQILFVGKGERPCCLPSQEPKGQDLKAMKASRPLTGSRQLLPSWDNLQASLLAAPEI